MAVKEIALPEDLKSAREDYIDLQKLKKADVFLSQIGDAFIDSIFILIVESFSLIFLYFIVSRIFPEFNAQYFTVAAAIIIFLLTLLGKRSEHRARMVELESDENLTIKAELHKQIISFNLSVSKFESVSRSGRFSQDDIGRTEAWLITRKNKIMHNLDQFYGLVLESCEEAGLQQARLLAETSDLPRTPVLDQVSETACRNIEDTISAIELEEDLSRR